MRHTGAMSGTSARTPARRGRPPDTDSAQTRQRILDRARVAFASRGYDSSTNRSLGDDVGITAGAIYHYFGSKLDLYLAVHTATQRHVYDTFGAAAASESTFRGRLEAVLEAAHELNHNDPTLAQFLGSVRVDMRRDPVLAEALAHAATTRQDFVDSMVEVGLRTGEIRADDRRIVRALVLTVLIGLADEVAGDLVEQRVAIDAIYDALDGNLFELVS